MLILLVEDHQAIRQMLKMAIVRDQHEVIEAGDVASAKQLLLDEEPDLAIVDWMLPDISGVDLIRWLRQQKAIQQTPVIMLTAKAEEIDTIKGLDAGADDYMIKPVAINELLARIRALWRRPRQFDANHHIIEYGRLQINTTQHQVLVDGQVVVMRQSEYNLLKFFLTYPDRIWSREQILNRVWGRSVYLDERTVDVHILRLRKNLKPHGLDKLLGTVRGVGYQFKGI